MSEQIIMNTLFSSYSTNNPILDIALRTMILTAITAIMNYVSNKCDLLKVLYKYLCNILYTQKKYPEIIMEAESIDVSHAGKKIYSKMNYSKAFLAILHYINIHPELNIKIFKETSAFNENRDKDAYYSHYNENNEREMCMKLNDKYYIPYTKDEFLINNDLKIYCHIDINLTKEVDNNDDNNKSKENNSKSQNIHQIKLYIKNGSINDLKTFINKLILNHEKDQQQKLVEEQYFFNFRKCVDYDEKMNAEWEEIKFKTNKRFEHIFFEKKNELMSQIDFFINRPDWYEKHGMPHHLGILLYGKPGCGKTSTIKVIAQKTGYSVIMINLNRIKSSRELESIFYSETINKKYIPNSKRIYVFEDIDCLSNIVLERSENSSETSSVNGDDNSNDIMKLASAIVGQKDNNSATLLFKEDNDKLNLSCLLNLIDGIIETPGRIIIMTSNYPEKIDEALKRPGRMDLHIELKRASKAIVLEILSNFYEISIENIQNNYTYEVDLIKEDYYSPAQISNFCLINKSSIKSCLDLLGKYN